MLKAYIAPHKTDVGFRYSVFLDDLAGIHENSPSIETLFEAVTWAGGDLRKSVNIVGSQEDRQWFSPKCGSRL